MKHIKFVVFGRPMPHQRTRVGRHGHHYNLPEQVAYQLMVAQLAKAACVEAGNIFFDKPVKLNCKFRCSHMVKDKKKLETWGGRSDLDNCIKQICDSLNAVIWKDDRIVCSIEADMKFTDGKEHSLIEITEIE